MKICLIHNLYGDFAVGGAEKLVKKMSQQFLAKGDKVFIITTKPYFWPKRENEKRGQTENNEYNENIYYLRSFYANLNSWPLFLRFFWHIFDMFDLLTAIKIKKILNKEKPDIVFTHNLKGISLLTPLFIKIIGIRHSHFLHDIQLFYPSGLLMVGQEEKTKSLAVKVYCFLCRFLFNCVKQIISPSEWLLFEHSRRGFFKQAEKKIKRPEPNLKKSIFLLNKRKAVGFLKFKQEFIFLYAGQIEREKGIFFLLDSFKLLRQEMPKANLKLILAGNGCAFKEAVKYQGEDIIFTGKLDFAKLESIMRDCGCLVVPSLCYENAPMIIFEAIEAGLPVLAAAAGGIPEIINIYGGGLFRVGDRTDLVLKMKSIINEYDIFLDKIKQCHLAFLKKSKQNFSLLI